METIYYHHERCIKSAQVGKDNGKKPKFSKIFDVSYIHIIDLTH